MKVVVAVVLVSLGVAASPYHQFLDAVILCLTIVLFAIFAFALCRDRDGHWHMHFHWHGPSFRPGGPPASGHATAKAKAAGSDDCDDTREAAQQRRMVNNMRLAVAARPGASVASVALQGRSTTARRTCPKCGCSPDGRGAFCTACGTRVESPPAQQQQQQQQQAETPSPPVNGGASPA